MFTSASKSWVTLSLSMHPAQLIYYFRRCFKLLTAKSLLEFACRFPTVLMQWWILYFHENTLDPSVVTSTGTKNVWHSSLRILKNCFAPISVMNRHHSTMAATKAKNSLLFKIVIVINYLKLFNKHSLSVAIQKTALLIDLVHTTVLLPWLLMLQRVSRSYKGH